MTDLDDDHHDVDYTAKYHRGDEFSAAAHDETGDAVRRTQRLRILAHIANTPGGCTCDEVEQALGLPHQTASARIAELRHKAQIVTVNGEWRRTRTGSRARVHRVVPRWPAP